MRRGDDDARNAADDGEILQAMMCGTEPSTRDSRVRGDYRHAGAQIAQREFEALRGTEHRKRSKCADEGFVAGHRQPTRHVDHGGFGDAQVEESVGMVRLEWMTL